MNINIMGVYKIINLVNEKVYIGSSKDIPNRWKQHSMMLKNNKHHSIHLQNAWNKYGEDNFKFEIIEIVDNEAILKEKEQIWMDDLQSYNPQYGYNISSDAKVPEAPIYKSSKIHIVDKKSIGKIINLGVSMSTLGFYCVIREFVNDQNILYYDEKPINQKKLCEITKLGRKAIINNLYELEEVNLIKKVKIGHDNIIYINPLYYRGSRNIKPDIFEMFENRGIGA